MTENLKTKIEVMQNELRNVKKTALASVKQNTVEHNEIKADVKEIAKKIDEAMEQKADRSEVKEIKDKAWQIILAVVVAVIGALFAIIKSYSGTL